jgi:hypothetical protein
MIFITVALFPTMKITPFKLMAMALATVTPTHNQPRPVRPLPLEGALHRTPLAPMLVVPRKRQRMLTSDVWQYLDALSKDVKVSRLGMVLAASSAGMNCPVN